MYIFEANGVSIAKSVIHVCTRGHAKIAISARPHSVWISSQSSTTRRSARPTTTSILVTPSGGSKRRPTA